MLFLTIPTETYMFQCLLSYSQKIYNGSVTLHRSSHTHLHQPMYIVSIILHGAVLLPERVSFLVQLYEWTFFVVLSAKHGLFAPSLHHTLNGITVFPHSINSTDKVLYKVFGVVDEAPAVLVLPRQAGLCSRQLQVYWLQLSSDEREFHL